VDRLRETLKAHTGEERSALDLVAEKEAKQEFDQRGPEPVKPQQERVKDREISRALQNKISDRGISR